MTHGLPGNHERRSVSAPSSGSVPLVRWHVLLLTRHNVVIVMYSADVLLGFAALHLAVT